MKASRPFARAMACLFLQLPLAAAMRAPAGAVPLLTGFGGPTGYGLSQNCVHPNDDGSYSGPPPASKFSDPVAIPITAASPRGSTSSAPTIARCT